MASEKIELISESFLLPHKTIFVLHVSCESVASESKSHRDLLMVKRAGLDMALKQLRVKLLNCSFLLFVNEALTFTAPSCPQTFKLTRIPFGE
jgi:hypothetical protein